MKLVKIRNEDFYLPLEGDFSSPAMSNELIFVDEVSLDSKIFNSEKFLTFLKQSKRVLYQMDWDASLLDPVNWEKVIKPSEVAVKISMISSLGLEDAFISEWEPRLKKITELGFKVWLSFDVSEDLILFPKILAAFYRLGFKNIYLRNVENLGESKIEQLKKSFSFFRMRNYFDLEIYFDFFSKKGEALEIATECTFSGLHIAHIDLSNRCTHSCVFCADYSDAAIEQFNKLKSDELMKGSRDYLRDQISLERAQFIISTLPHTVKNVQFGGLGDPMTHPNCIEIFEMARNRGFNVEVLSNMEYFTNSSIESLHKIGTRFYGNFSFIANISGVTEATYLATRPRQTEKTFNRVVENLKTISKLRNENGGAGIHFVMMCVMNKLNYKELELYIDRSAEWGASAIYLKPFELHNPINSWVGIDKENEDFPSILERAILKADQYKLPLIDRPLLELIIQNGVIA